MASVVIIVGCGVLKFCFLFLCDTILCVCVSPSLLSFLFLAYLGERWLVYLVDDSVEMFTFRQVRGGRL